MNSELSTWKLWLKVAVIPAVISIVYFLLVYMCWHYIGYGGFGVFFGMLIFLVKCGAFPIWSATRVNLIRNYFSNRAITSIVFVVFGVYLIACVYLNYWIYIHASGYYDHYFIGPNRSNETIGVGSYLTIFLSIIAIAVYIISFWITRKSTTHITEENQMSRH